MDKAVIIKGYVSDRTDGTGQIALDDIVDQSVNYIKMDIEGYEKLALSGAERIFSENKNLRCAICAYHCHEDEEWIKKFLGSHGYRTDCSRGYICPDWCPEGRVEAELRRGIVFGAAR
jgi:Pyruvate/2-oxoacid:ferredoxin oxidoreductase delta subunit